MTIQQINQGLKIVKLKGEHKFKAVGGYYKPEGYTLYNAELGYLSFKEDGGDYPYMPMGGRKALKSILEAGGLLNFDNVNWLQPLK